MLLSYQVQHGWPNWTSNALTGQQNWWRNCLPPQVLWYWCLQQQLHDNAQHQFPDCVLYSFISIGTDVIDIPASSPVPYSSAVVPESQRFLLEPPDLIQVTPRWGDETVRDPSVESTACSGVLLMCLLCSSSVRELSPVELAQRQNQQLMAAYKARMDRLWHDAGSQQTVSLSLTLQRRLAENMAIAQAREQAVSFRPHSPLSFSPSPTSSLQTRVM